MMMKPLLSLIFLLSLSASAWSSPKSSPNFEGLILGKSPAGELLLDGAKVQGLLGDLGSVARSARIIPHYKDGKMLGFKLFGIRKGSLFPLLGFKNGDVIISLGGVPMTSPMAAMMAYQRFQGEEPFEVRLRRRRVEHRLLFKIQGDVSSLKSAPLNLKQLKPRKKSLAERNKASKQKKPKVKSKTLRAK